MLDAVITFCIAFVISIFATRGAMALGWRFGIIDKPAPDKVHERAVPRIGGLGIAAGFLATTILMLVRQHSPQPEIIGLCAGAVAIAGIGLLDDILCLKPIVKLAGVAIAAAIPLAVGLGPASMGGAIAAWAFVIFMSNAMNLLDGLDGLAGSVALIAALAFFVIFRLLGLGIFAGVSLSLAGAVLGFLIFNLPPARTFMGDTGSLLLGYLLAWQAIMLGGQSSGGLVAAISIVAIPIADTLFVVCRRASRRQSILAGGLDHTYNLLAGSIGRPAAVLSFCGAASILGTLAVVFSRL